MNNNVLIQLAKQQIKVISPMTFSQKLYQAQKLEKLKNWLDKIVELPD